MMPISLAFKVLFTAAVFLLMSFGSPPAVVAVDHIAVEETGSLVGTEDVRVIRIDPLAGALTVISGCPAPVTPCPEELIGTGPAFQRLRDIAVEADGALVVADDFDRQGVVVRVDPLSGDRTVISNDRAGSGPLFHDPQAVTVEASGSLVVAGSNSIVPVDPLSGNRVVVSGCLPIGPTCSEVIGSGPAIACVFDIAVEAEGSLVGADGCARPTSPQGVVIRVDPVIGERTIVSQSHPDAEVANLLGIDMRSEIPKWT
jgi:hypothetical protein